MRFNLFGRNGNGLKRGRFLKGLPKGEGLLGDRLRGAKVG